ncbi:unnamed protein product [Adineta steineri]|uniref:Uncharacterized protein n=1 Tax=Adineta steineri TaxID=433720 RepID=A0A815H8S9_9BILA|nr:unnamed protein product [Adineta steineri]CAF4041673.1 unnamed protein product [Adineta steineri]
MELKEIYELETSEDSEATTSKEISCFRDQPTINIKEKNISLSSKSKRRCVFNKQWLNDPKYASFLRECRTDKYSDHYSICKSDFSIANGGVYLINSHIEHVLMYNVVLLFNCIVFNREFMN